jgi:ubiquinone/menaquinone biosynthesis C-methylase UbiE
MEYLQGQVFESYSSHNLRRLSGELPEKESSKAVVEILRPVLTPGEEILEVGCSVGHLARTLGRLNLNLKYTGVDIDHYAVNRGIEYLQKNHLFGIQSASLIHAEAESLPFEDNSFQTVISLNVLEHLKQPAKAIREFLRCSNKYLLMRTLMSDQTFIVQEVRNANHKHLGYEHLELPSPKDELDEYGVPKVFVYQNVYSLEFIRGIVEEGGKAKTCEIFEDSMFSQEAFDIDNKLSSLPRKTQVIEGKQVRGLFIDTNHWIMIEKEQTN